MREFAKEIYFSKQWRKVREYIYHRDFGLCVSCGSIGEEVHHRTPLTPSNIHDHEIVFGEDNLELLCRECHRSAHGGSPAADPALAFDSLGNLVLRSGNEINI